MNREPSTDHLSAATLPALLYFFGRLVVFLALIPNSYDGPGDLPTYTAWAGLPGWPYFQFWSEYPPLFPFINVSLFKISGGQPFFYSLYLALVLALAGSACLVIFHQIAKKVWDDLQAERRTWLFLGLLLPLPYTWWYFELLPLAFMLLGILWLIEDRPWRSGFAVGVGMLLKWFPGLLLAAAWRYRKPGPAGRVTAAALGLTALLFAGLYLVSPEMTGASLRAQSARTSWQTAWALLDGNMTTGAFLLLEDRLDSSIAGIPRGSLPAISSMLTLIAFAALGLWLFWRVRSQATISLLAFLGLTWVVFLTWSPGWSPQWILYLIPLILLTLPPKSAIYGASGLILLTLLEWPTLLGHGVFAGLWLIVPLRLLLFAWLGWRWYRLIRLT